VPATPSGDPVTIELSYWETIKNSIRADDFKSYLEKYPDGQFTALARNNINSLGASAKSEPRSSNDSATELAFWDSVKNSNRVEDFQAYLKRYPDGACTQLAKNRMAALETAARERGKTEAIKKSSLEGTTWRCHYKGDRYYAFQFLPNGE